MSAQSIDSTPLGAAGFAAMTGASDKTMDRLNAYAVTLVQWQKRLNLVGPSTLQDPWRRHFLDSAQLAHLLPHGEGVVVDMGSGAGFPGMVLSIMEDRPVRLIDSNGRKCGFLRHVAGLTRAPVMVETGRLEDQPRGCADVVVARALAPLDKLLNMAHPLLAEGGRGLFLKGQRVDAELTESRKRWKMSVSRRPSISDPRGCILVIERLEPRHAG